MFTCSKFVNVIFVLKLTENCQFFDARAAWFNIARTYSIVLLNAANIPQFPKVLILFVLSLPI